MFGGVAAQDHLKQVLVALNMHLVAQPAVIVASAERKFNLNDELIDPDTKQFIKRLLANLVDLTRRLARPEEPLQVAPLST